MRKLWGIILFILFFNLALWAEGFEEQEKEFFDSIKTYSNPQDYLNLEDIKILNKLKKEGLVMGYEDQYDIDALTFKRLMKKHLGIDITLVSKPWNDLLEGMKSGEIHMLANLSYVENRTEYIRYFQPYQRDTVYLIYPKGETLTSFENLRGKNVFYTKESVHVTAFQQLKDIYDVNLIPKETLGLKDLEKDTYILSDRLIIYSIIHQGLTNLRYTELFNTDPIFIGTSKKLSIEYTKLLEKIMNNYINNRLGSYLDFYSNHLNQKFMDSVLTESEKTYINLLDKAFIVLDKNQFYISYIDKNDYEYKGSLVDIAKKWTKYSKDAVLVPLGSQSEKIIF